MTYAGDLPSSEAAKALAADPNAVIIDVRTDAEWNYVGIPFVDNLHLVSWIFFPNGAQNFEFVDQVRARGIKEDQPLYLLCRSGVRSAAAATVLTAAGYQTCYNISDGFEGDKDSNGHRGKVNGWKHAGLPWQQG